MSKFKPGDKLRFVAAVGTNDLFDARYYVGPHPLRPNQAVYLAVRDGAVDVLATSFEDELELALDPKEEAVKKAVRLLGMELGWSTRFAREAVEILDGAGLLKY